jgi:putative peptidoglycan lipid II flippase
MGVAIGVALGACVHALVQVPFVIKVGLFPRLSLKFNYKSIRRVAELSLPRTLTLSTNHLATIFLVALASSMVAGSISIYSLSLNLQSVPLSIIGVSYSLAAFPTLSRHFANKNIAAFVNQMAVTARHIIFWSLTVTALFIVLRAQIVRVLLGTGEFDWNATRLTAASLALFSLSAVFQSLMLLFMRAFYSAGHTKKPFWINVISMAVLIGCTYGLVHIFNAFEGFRLFIGALLKVDDLPGTVVLMLPLGYSIGTIMNGIIHWIGFEKDFPGFSKQVERTLFESFAASVIIGAVSYYGLVVFEPLFNNSSLIGLFLQGLCAGLLGIASGVFILYLLKSKELEEGWKAIHGKFRKTKVIATDPEIV